MWAHIRTTAVARPPMGLVKRCAGFGHLMWPNANTRIPPTTFARRLLEIRTMNRGNKIHSQTYKCRCEALGTCS